MFLYAYEDIEEVKIIGSWRKANAIHNWFDRTFGGIESDVEYFVKQHHLVELQNLCEQVLENEKMAKELLPTTDGFFFGSTEYDEYYFENLHHTIKIINKALSLPEYTKFIYSSNW